MVTSESAGPVRAYSDPATLLSAVPKSPKKPTFTASPKALTSSEKSIFTNREIPVLSFKVSIAVAAATVGMNESSNDFVISPAIVVI